MSSGWHERKRTARFHIAARLALAGMLTALMTVAVSCALTDARVPVSRQPTIDPEVRVATRRGTARVLVELSIPETDSASRPRLIEGAQNELLHRLRGASVRVFRRYTTIPLLGLEIDAETLARLEAMSDLVTHVRIDVTVRPSTHRTDEALSG
jgi:hypothetical protein